MHKWRKKSKRRGKIVSLYKVCHIAGILKEPKKAPANPKSLILSAFAAIF
ncbi:hypothetical protein HMPREF1572_01119 [Gardnerella vaginalis JCP7275]|nr:hypothetical protein HMPREF1572_01119 [Gardnerella vaginalis JCP7275]